MISSLLSGAGGINWALNDLLEKPIEKHEKIHSQQRTFSEGKTISDGETVWWTLNKKQTFYNNWIQLNQATMATEKQ